MRASRLQLILILLVLGLILLRESHQPPGSIIENHFVDWLASNTSRELPTAPLTLVEINDASVTEGHKWPWSPLDFSLFLQAALPFNPSVLAIEHVLLWDEKTGGDADWQAKRPQYEKILHDFLLRVPKVLLGAQLGFPEDPDIIPPLQPAPVLRHLNGSVGLVPEFTIIDRQPKEEFRLAPKLGFTNLPASEGVIRRVPLLLRYRGEVVPSFALQAILLWYEVTADDVEATIGSHIDIAGRVRIPIDVTGSVRTYFKAPYLRFGFDDLLLAAQQKETGRASTVPVEKMKGSITLLARTDAAARTLRFPSGIQGSSGELTAAAIATIQNGAFIRRIPAWGDWVILVGLLGLCAGFAGWSRSRVLQVALATAVIYLMISLSIFTHTLVWLPLIMPGGVLLFTVLFRLFSAEEIPARK
jgi:adenylate cyclase